MIGEQEAKRILELALNESKADQAEAMLIVTHSDVTRFANSAIHQNMSEQNVELRLRAVCGRRIGITSTNQLTPKAIAEAVETARRSAELSGENHDFVSLPGPEPTQIVNSYHSSTANCLPNVRAKIVSVICRKAVSAGLNAAGVLTTAGSELAVANSLGVFAYHPTSYADLVTVVMSDDSSGYAERASIDVQCIEAESVADEAIDRALRGRAPIDLAPGEYETILEPYAVHDIVEFMANLGFSALPYLEGRSFVVGNLGKQVSGKNITLWDDGLDQSGIPMPFDFEGVPKQHVDLIHDGIAMKLLHDSRTAAKSGTHSTGHAKMAPNPNGPAPMNLFMATGQATMEEMIASTKRGLLVTRFHYTNPADRKRVIITGMTRDGTFLIENGEIVCPVKNLRFTQSYLTALSDVHMIGNTALLHREWLGGIKSPALKIGHWNFQQATLY